MKLTLQTTGQKYARRDACYDWQLVSNNPVSDEYLKIHMGLVEAENASDSLGNRSRL
jgi:hypothetical protein